MAETESLGMFGYRVTVAIREKANRDQPVGQYAYQHWANYQAQVAKRVDEATGKQIYTCRYCKQPVIVVQHQYGCYPYDGRVLVVAGTGTTADGLSYCPPNPDYRGKFKDHKVKAN